MDIGLQYVRGQVSPQDYWNEKFEAFTFDSACRGCEQWIEKLRSEVDQGFWRLHALSRGSPFWEHSNGLATVGKLREFAQLELASDPGNVHAGWLSIATCLHFHTNELDPVCWRALKQAGEFDADFLVQIACNMVGSLLPRDVALLRDFATEIEVLDDVNAALARHEANKENF